jgi:hypothetical protein
MHSLEVSPPIELTSTNRKKFKQKQRNLKINYKKNPFYYLVSSSPLESYATDDVTEQIPASNSPPLCPPHLLRALLNTAPEDGKKFAFF